METIPLSSQVLLGHLPWQSIPLLSEVVGERVSGGVLSLQTDDGTLWLVDGHDVDSIAEYRLVIHLIIIISVERAEEDGKRNSMEVDGPRITAQPGWNPYTKRDSSEIVHWLAQVLTFITNIIILVTVINIIILITIIVIINIIILSTTSTSDFEATLFGERWKGREFVEAGGLGRVWRVISGAASQNYNNDPFWKVPLLFQHLQKALSKSSFSYFIALTFTILTPFTGFF